MVTDEKFDESDKKYVCCACIREKYLANMVSETGIETQCSYCQQHQKGIEINDLADWVETAFEDHFVRTSTGPDHWQEIWLRDPESNYDWHREGMPIAEAIAWAAEVDDKIAADIQEILDDRHGDFDSAAMGEETEFSSDSYYEDVQHVDGTWRYEWNKFEHSLKHEARFFSGDAEALLASIFNDIEKLPTGTGAPIVKDIGPQTDIDALWRARSFEAASQALKVLERPDRDLSAPPPNLARAGRMNAHGIPVFYGGTNCNAAIAEVRPPIGAYVVAAKFKLIRPLKVLDMTVLEQIRMSYSFFDPRAKEQIERIHFLQILGDLLTQPVMPGDQALDYLATQVVSDYLATHNNPTVDGIMFRSVQCETGKNIVLFNKAARMREMDIPAGTNFEVSDGYETEEGYEVSYTVYETAPEPVPPPSAIPKAESAGAFDATEFLASLHPPEWEIRPVDPREETLEIDAESVAIHVVRQVQYTTEANSVTRQRRYDKKIKGAEKF